MASVLLLLFHILPLEMIKYCRSYSVLFKVLQFIACDPGNNHNAHNARLSSAKSPRLSTLRPTATDPSAVH